MTTLKAVAHYLAGESIDAACGPGASLDEQHAFMERMAEEASHMLAVPVAIGRSGLANASRTEYDFDDHEQDTRDEEERVHDALDDAFSAACDC